MFNDNERALSIHLIEELSLNAWPAAQTLVYDGWLLRFSDGYTRRANSVQPLGGSSLDVQQKIAYCEQAYAARGLPAIFKLTPAAQPADLDARLAALGYRREAPTLVQLLHLTDVMAPRDREILLEPALTDRWLEAYARLSALDPRHLPAMRRLLAGIVPERRFAALTEHGTVIALGLVVLERGYAGVFDVVVGPAHRRRGLATELVSGLLRWARARGAEHAYLQVVEDNVAARRLYAHFGFRDAYTYWYRVKQREPFRPGAQQHA